MNAIDDATLGGFASARVKEFYDLLVHGRGQDAAAFVEANFADNATLKRPESLPGGGTLTGAATVAKFMRAAASAVSGLSVNSVHGSVSPNEISVFAHLTIDLGGTTTTAIEWWTFAGGKVSSIVAYYWDTAALLATNKR